MDTGLLRKIGRQFFDAADKIEDRESSDMNLAEALCTYVSEMCNAVAEYIEQEQRKNA